MLIILKDKVYEFAIRIYYDSSCFYLCKIYYGLAHDELKTIKSCVLVDEFERSLKN